MQSEALRWLNRFLDFYALVSMGLMPPGNLQARFSICISKSEIVVFFYSQTPLPFSIFSKCSTSPLILIGLFFF
jgi:hypothetical protein